jgi:hypothetical protein
MTETKISLTAAELQTAIEHLVRIGEKPGALRIVAEWFQSKAEEQADTAAALSGLADALDADALGLAQLLAEEIAEDNPPATAEPEPLPEFLPDEPIPVEPDDLDAGPFAEGGAYAWLPDGYSIPAEEVPDWVGGGGPLEIQMGPALEPMPNVTPRFTAGWGQGELVDLAQLGAQGAREINPGASSGVEHYGPLHYVRAFNATGELGDFDAWRVGDFKNGREGHVVYLNATALEGVPTRVADVVGIQHGGQLVQVVWRETEDGSPIKLPEEFWPEQVPGSTLALQRLVSIDGGVINEGTAVRASWPISIFTPGHELIQLDKLWVRCNHPQPFKTSSKGDCRAHGALIVENDGKRPMRSGLVEVSDFRFEVTDSDRAVCRFGDVDEVRLYGGVIREHGARRGIGIVSNVLSFRIDADVDWSGPIRIFDPANRWGSPRFVTEHVAGTVTDLQPTDYA